jgi:hypothetical protein
MAINETPLLRLQSGYIGDCFKWMTFFEHFTGLPELSSISIGAIDCARLAMRSVGDSGRNISLEFKKRYGLDAPKSYIDFIAAGGIGLYTYMYVLRGVNNRVPGEILQAYFDINETGYFKDMESLWYEDLVGAYGNFGEATFSGYYSYRRYLDGKERQWAEGSEKSAFQAIKYLKDCILVGRHFAPELMLLNTVEITSDGEMEAFSFDSTDILRFKSFAELFINDIVGLVRSVNKTGGGRLPTLSDLKYIGADIIMDIGVLSRDVSGLL